MGHASFIRKITVVAFLCICILPPIAPFVQALPLEREPVSYSLKIGELQRTFHVHVPQAINAKNLVPLVVVMHGGGGDGLGMQKLARWDEKADKEGFIVAYPDGVGRKAKGKVLGSWNGGRCCPPANQLKINDVEFISRMIDDLGQRYGIDLKRVYATGHSNGGIMAYRLACELSEKISAIGPMGAQGVFDDCNPKEAVPVMHIHGKADRCALYGGGECGGCFTEYLSKLYGKSVPAYKWRCNSVPDSLLFWKKMNGVIDAPSRISYQKGSAQCLSFGLGHKGGEVVLCVDDVMGHAYPGGVVPLPCRESFHDRKCQLFLEIVGASSTNLLPEELLWDFFSRKSKP